MKQILTDDELKALRFEFCGVEEIQRRTVEAVLAKLAQQEPAAWMFFLKVRTETGVKSEQTAAIDYNPAGYETILRKEPLYYTAPMPSPNLQAELGYAQDAAEAEAKHANELSVKLGAVTRQRDDHL